MDECFILSLNSYQIYFEFKKKSYMIYLGFKSKTSYINYEYVINSYFYLYIIHR